MKVTGKIILYTRDGRQLKSRDYFTVNGRRNIVADWKELLEDKNSGCYYHIAPLILEREAKSHRIAENRMFKNKKEEEKKPFIRPKAIYSNNKSLYE
jgi:hypothetical protein